MPPRDADRLERPHQVAVGDRTSPAAAPRLERRPCTAPRALRLRPVATTTGADPVGAEGVPDRPTGSVAVPTVLGPHAGAAPRTPGPRRSKVVSRVRHAIPRRAAGLPQTEGRGATAERSCAPRRSLPDTEASSAAPVKSRPWRGGVGIARGSSNAPCPRWGGRARGCRGSTEALRSVDMELASP